jgi:hypothetical protein
MSLVGALTKALKAGETAKKTAPFYSAVDEALANIARPKGTGAEFLTELSKQPGVKKAELADRKLEQAFKAKGKMTKEEAQQVLKENPPPKISEKTLEEMSDDARDERFRELMENKGYESYGDLTRGDRHKFEEQLAAEDVQHAEHRLPGGSNYREILLKLPEAFTEMEANRLMELESKLERGNLPAWQMEQLNALQAKKQSSPESFRTLHWREEPNVLAHMRVIDRKGPNGEKILHVEEVQSDWHQTARKRGYKTPEDMNLEQEFRNYGKELPERFYQKAQSEGMTLDQAKELSADWLNPDFASKLGEKEKFDAYKNSIQANKDRIPDAPFKKNWHELAMKRLLNYAADNGYDSIAITPGMEQAKRWNNEALKVHYDQKIPQFLNEFGRPYGAEVGQMPFDAGGYKVSRDSNELPYRLERLTSPDVISRFATPDEAWAEAEKLGQLPLHHFKITPEMRESIKQKGLPLYQQVGIPTAGAGAASQMAEPEEGMAGGGSVAKMAALAKLAKLKEEMMPRAEAVKALMAKDEGKYLRDVTPDVLTNAEIEAEIARMKARAEASQPEVKKADGGAINFDTAPDMSDGGRIIQGAPFKRGGKVNMTANRDTMFLELSNKKLKRK